jgi:hypothetical protein
MGHAEQEALWSRSSVVAGACGGIATGSLGSIPAPNLRLSNRKLAEAGRVPWGALLALHRPLPIQASLPTGQARRREPNGPRPILAVDLVDRFGQRLILLSSPTEQAFLVGTGWADVMQAYPCFFVAGTLPIDRFEKAPGCPREGGGPGGMPWKAPGHAIGVVRRIAEPLRRNTTSAATIRYGGEPLGRGLGV